jgi:hypothetical protein
MFLKAIFIKELGNSIVKSTRGDIRFQCYFDQIYMKCILLCYGLVLRRINIVEVILVLFHFKFLLLFRLTDTPHKHDHLFIIYCIRFGYLPSSVQNIKNTGSDVTTEHALNARETL